MPVHRKVFAIILLCWCRAAFGQPAPSYVFTPAAQPGNIFSRYTALADIEGDGKLDIVTTDSSGIVVTPGNGDGTYRAGIRTALAVPVTAFSVADIDGDGRLDIIAVNGAITSSPQTITVLLATGGGSFRVAGNPALPASGLVLTGTNPIVLADFDGNGLPDIAIHSGSVSVNGVTYDSVSVWLNQGGGTFSKPTLSFIPPGVLSGSTAAIVAGDFNNDGHIDLVDGTAYGAIAVFLGNGDGTFANPMIFATSVNSGGQITSVAVADLNGDGKLDLVTCQNATVGQVFSSVTPYFGNGDGTFAAGATYQPSTTLSAPTVFTGITAGALVIADVTGDGKPDLISTNYRTNSFSEVIVYPGNGDGTFQLPSVYQTTAQAEFLSVADLNGDGRQDLVITSPSTSTQLSAVQILNGASGPYLRMNITSNSPIYMDQAAQFSVVVTNLGDQPTSGEIDVTPGAAVNSQSTIGPVPPASGWDCASVSMGNYYGAQCSRSDVLAPGASYPPIPVNGGVPQYGNPTTPTLTETVSGGGSARASGGAVVSLIPLNSVCPFTTPNPQTVSREGGTFSAPLGSPTNLCPVTVQSTVPWITLNLSAATYTVAPNTTGVTRTGTLSYSSVTGWSGVETIKQIGTACLYVVSPTIWNSDYRGQATPFFVNVENGCSVAPVTNATWVQISGVTSQIFYVQTLANNTNAYRSATIQVGDQVVTIYQPPS